VASVSAEASRASFEKCGMAALLNAR